jgi:4-hydroxybenzoate polyprenyltransferase
MLWRAKAPRVPYSAISRPAAQHQSRLFDFEFHMTQTEPAVPSIRRRSVPVLLLLSMRPHQWTKNLLLFAGVILSYHFQDTELLLRSTVGFALFCLLSGSIYILNDLADLEQDKIHPRKSRRPLASGHLSHRLAIVFAILVASIGITASFLMSIPFGSVAAAYFLSTIVYSLYCKHVVILDIILLALGFVLRAMAGILIIRVPGGAEIPMTPWFILCVFFLALFIAICKRRHELMFIRQATEHRKVLGQYTSEFINQMVAVCTTMSIISYVLYLVTVYGMADSDRGMRMLITLPFVIYGIFRYLYLVYRCSEGGEPETDVLKDKPLLLNILLWLVLLLVLQRWQ